MLFQKTPQARKIAAEVMRRGSFLLSSRLQTLQRFLVSSGIRLGFLTFTLGTLALLIQIGMHEQTDYPPELCTAHCTSRSGTDRSCFMLTGRYGFAIGNIAAFDMGNPSARWLRGFSCDEVQECLLIVYAGQCQSLLCTTYPELR